MSIKDLPALNSPLNDQQIGQLQQVTSALSSQQLAWVSGYLWGVSQTASDDVSASATSTQLTQSSNSASQLTIIYASQTGNAKGVAQALHQQVQEAGLPVALFDAADYKPKQLAKETHVVIVASTNGEGEAPDNALIFHEFLQSKKAPKLPSLHYAVLGLGDSSYEFFCQTGKDFDAALAKSGATALLERVDCDVDYVEQATQWRSNLVALLKDKLKDSLQESLGDSTANNTTTSNISGSNIFDLNNNAPQWSKQNPYTAQLLVSQKITGRDSDKTVHHVEIDLENSGLHYQPGDALGVWYKNDADLVAEILDCVGLSGVESVDVNGTSLSIHSALIEHYEITNSNPQFIKKYAEISGNKDLLALVEDAAKLREYSANTQIIDVLKQAKNNEDNDENSDVEINAEQLVGLLRPLTPRLYSIASSQAEVEEDVHLTVGLVEYQQDENARFGGASHYLTQRLEEGDEVKVFIESNAHFKLPEDDNAPVIMIGPGTGIAPFRSFIQEREARDASGKNWLLFGDRTFTQDFLYQVEWQNYLKSGLLTRLDLAFSRDQAEKVYVQDRLKENAAEVWQWLQQGAHIYVCGDATRMAKDVNDTLISIVAEQGKLDQVVAEEFINELRKTKRYQKDVY